MHLPHYIWSCDIAVFLKYKGSNRGYAYCLVAVDVFSKMTYLQPLKSRTANAVKDAFQSIFERAGVKPNKLWTDQERSFFSGTFKKYLSDNGIKIYNTFNSTKALHAERRILDLQRKIARHFHVTNKKNWVDIIFQIEKAFNLEYHSSIKARPVDINSEESVDKAWHNLYNDIVGLERKKPRFEIFDLVSISNERIVFTKLSTQQQYSSEIFQVFDRIWSPPVWRYRLRDTTPQQAVLAGTYLEEELIHRVKNGSD